MKVRITTTIDRDLKADLDRLSEIKGVSLASLVGRAIDRLLILEKQQQQQKSESESESNQEQD